MTVRCFAALHGLAPIRIGQGNGGSGGDELCVPARAFYAKHRAALLAALHAFCNRHSSTVLQAVGGDVDECIRTLAYKLVERRFLRPPPPDNNANANGNGNGRAAPTRGHMQLSALHISPQQIQPVSYTHLTLPTIYSV